MSIQEAQYAAQQDHWLETPHGRVFARVWTPPAAAREGRESPIVLFHDSLGCVELWRGFPARLSASTGRRVIAYDRLGFGRSAPRSDRPTADFIVEEAERHFPAVREGLGIGHFVAFGHSVGGGMAVHCASRFADACEALITESAQAFVEERTIAGLLQAKALFGQEEQFARLGKYHGDKARWVLDAWLDTWLSPGFSAWSLASVLPGVECPLLAIHGLDDEYGSPRHPELIAQWAGGPSRAEVLADTHHVPHREREQAVLDLVAGFLHAGRRAGS
ncbi:Alpha/beta hydrolase fold protein [Azotobacter vinelandii CA]|uniref:Alpha/beta hydrolase fold protein n=2 Tax=Azotobacter vinelandii TaxID=354 RepID=C1DJN8_AZOVD|nr:alpha/beta fold hydrolase [Azotobacter vinelandii]ACO78807.1 Alpha/beta hydrolase fold protein [Azotobacter vinelandii DJ]AGK14903.1 Alpha/beta hydrolase fold protein [Azotobacter vinelandii CA]AGK20761.1 Alpha/beta hydrolase fold protein [Azotobacter vinelandii CA6]WKN19753.1 alpha/beta hydrolase [Azotobacter vinelandii]SFX32181.1 Pimeloyl-ACP methyl ester carboxylesterase [Azotobacter vinelandii]